MNEFHRAWQRMFDRMRQANEFDQKDWETISGAAAQLRKVERAEKSRGTAVSNHTGVSRESSDRGRANAIKARRRKT